jgi:tRNA U38,U39,U40 pseudouridine synthase TruA
MIRRIIGASFDVASKKTVTIAKLRAILEEKNPEQALTNAPAKGLCLDSIFYKK